MSSLHECVSCGETVYTESTTAGAFKVPPQLEHVHEDGSTSEMRVIENDAPGMSNSRRRSE